MSFSSPRTKRSKVSFEVVGDISSTRGLRSRRLRFSASRAASALPSSQVSSMIARVGARAGAAMRCSVSAIHWFASSRVMTEARGWGVGWPTAGSKETSMVMGSKAAWETHSSMRGWIFETFLTTRRMAVLRLRTPSDMLVGSQLRNMARSASGSSRAASRSRASCHRASASDSKDSSMGLASMGLMR